MLNGLIGFAKDLAWSFIWILFSTEYETEIIAFSIIGAIIGLSLGITLLKTLNKYYLNNLPKDVVKKYSVFLKIFIVLGFLSIGCVSGIKIAFYKYVPSFVYKYENKIYAEIKQDTGIDITASLDEIFGISEFENKLNNEIIELKQTSEPVTKIIESYYSIAGFQSEILPLFNSLSDIYKEYEDVISIFGGLDKFKENPMIAYSLDLFDSLNSLAKVANNTINGSKSYVDFIEEVSNIRDDIEFLKTFCIGDFLHSYVLKFSDSFQNYANSKISPYFWGIIFLSLFLITLFMLIIIKRHNAHLKGILDSKLNNKERSHKNVKNIVLLILSTLSIIFWIIISIILIYIDLAGLGIFILIHLCLACVPAFIAKNKGYVFWNWYIYGVWVWLIAFIHSLCVVKNNQELSSFETSKESNYVEKSKEEAKLIETEDMNNNNIE